MVERDAESRVHGTRVARELVVWALGSLAEGLGICAVARVFEVAPNTVLQWLVEAADHLTVFSQYFLHDVWVTPVQLDDLLAMLRAVKAGEVRAGAAIQRLSRAPHGVWAAIDPVSKLVLTIDVRDRTLARTQRSIRLCRCWHRAVCRGFSPLGSTRIALHYWPISATGCSCHAARPQAPLPSPAGCRCPRCSMRKWSHRSGADTWSACATAWCSAP
jgi:hypothetical protein